MKQDINFLDDNKNTSQLRFFIVCVVSALALLAIVYLLTLWAKSRVFSPFVDYDPVANIDKTAQLKQTNHGEQKSEREWFQYYEAYRKQVLVKPSPLTEPLKVLLDKINQSPSLTVKSLQLDLIGRKSQLDLTIFDLSSAYSRLRAIPSKFLNQIDSVDIESNRLMRIKSTLALNEALPKQPIIKSLADWETLKNNTIATQEKADALIDKLLSSEKCTLQSLRTDYQNKKKLSKTDFKKMLFSLSLSCGQRDLLDFIQQVESYGVMVFWQSANIKFSKITESQSHQLQFLIHTGEL